MTSPTEITVPQLARLIGTPKAPVLVDIRSHEDFSEDPQLVPGAFRYPYDGVAELASKLTHCRVVVLCHRGRKLSQGAAAILRDLGIAAETLEGVVVAWREAGEPMVPAAALPKPNADGRTVWVTRHRPKIDRIACPWLIRRFVDPNALFLFVTPAEVMNVAEKFEATPFDVEDVFWSHRGERCSFDVMIEEFALVTEPLQRLALIIRGADTNRHDLAPEAAGLLAASLGLSRMYRDDLEQLEAGMLLYDAFYRWTRDAVDEGHDWPSWPSRS
jgi:rhodanese-related sulfurtransferase